MRKFPLPDLVRGCAGCSEVDNLPRLCIQSEDGRRWTDFHPDCATEAAVAAARRPENATVLNEES